MKKLAAAAAVLLLTGCATVPMKAPQVNRAAKADKYTKSAKIVQPAPMPTPNQVVPKRWFPKYKIKWLHK
jgi:uncharacterized lipoprotein YajG